MAAVARPYTQWALRSLRQLADAAALLANLEADPAPGVGAKKLVSVIERVES